jgi:hypothetical protein
LSFRIDKVIELKALRYKYTFKHGIKVNLVTALGEAVINQLINEHRPWMDLEEFNQLPEKTLDLMIQETAMPKNTEEWIRYLRQSVSFPDLGEYRPTITNFKQLYLACMTFNRSFMLVYNYLSKAIHLAPDLWTARKVPGGQVVDETLISIYLSFFPYHSGYSLHKLLIGKDRSTSTMKEYTSKFCVAMCEKNKECQSLNQLSLIMFEWKQKMPSNRPDKRLVHSVHHLSAGDLQDHLLYALYDKNAKPTLPKSQMPCWSRMRNKCFLGSKCDYSHNPRVLSEGRDLAVKELMSFDYYSLPDDQLVLSKPTDAKPSAIRSNGYRRDDMHHVVEVVDSDDEDITDEQYEEMTQPIA